MESKPIFYLSLTTIYYLYPFCKAHFCYLRYLINICAARTSDSGWGSRGESLPITLTSIKSQTNASIFIYKLAVGLYYMVLHLIYYFHERTALFWAKIGTYCIKHTGNRNTFLNTPLDIPQPKCGVWASPDISIWIDGMLS